MVSLTGPPKAIFHLQPPILLARLLSSPAPAARRSALGARARPHTSRGRPRRLSRARRRPGPDLGSHVRVDFTRTQNLYFMTTSDTAAARRACAATHFMLKLAPSAVRVSVRSSLCASLLSSLSLFPLFRAHVFSMTTGGTAVACRARAATRSLRAFALFVVRPSVAFPRLSPYLTSTVFTSTFDYFCPSLRVFRRYNRSELRS